MTIFASPAAPSRGKPTRTVFALHRGPRPVRMPYLLVAFGTGTLLVSGSGLPACCRPLRPEGRPLALRPFPGRPSLFGAVRAIFCPPDQL